MNKIIYSIEKMKQLVEMGFYPIQTIPNPKNAKYNCWVFKMTDELNAALDEVFRHGQNE